MMHTHPKPTHSIRPVLLVPLLLALAACGQNQNLQTTNNPVVKPSSFERIESAWMAWGDQAGRPTRFSPDGSHLLVNTYLNVGGVEVDQNSLFQLNPLRKIAESQNNIVGWNQSGDRFLIQKDSCTYSIQEVKTYRELAELPIKGCAANLGSSANYWNPSDNTLSVLVSQEFGNPALKTIDTVSGDELFSVSLIQIQSSSQTTRSEPNGISPERVTLTGSGYHISANNRFAIVRDPDGLGLWEMASSKVIRLTDNVDFYFRFLFSPDGEKLAVLERSPNNKLQVKALSSRTGQQLFVPVETAADYVRASALELQFAWSADGSRLFVTQGRLLSVINATTGALMYQVEVGSATGGLPGDGGIGGVSNSTMFYSVEPKGIGYFTVSQYKLFYRTNGPSQPIPTWEIIGFEVRNTNTGVKLAEYFAKQPFCEPYCGWNFGVGGRDQFTLPTFATDSSRFVYSYTEPLKSAPESTDQTIREFNLTTNQERIVGFKTIPNNFFFTSIISDDLSKIAYTSLEGIDVRRLDNDERITLIEEARGHSRTNVYGLAVRPNSTQLSSVGNDGFGIVWNTEEGKALKQVTANNRGLYTSAWSPNGTQLLTAGVDGLLRLWNPDTEEQTSLMSGHTYVVRSVAWSPNGNQIASGSWDRTVRLWNPGTGENTQTITDHTDYVNSMAYSPNGLVLASGSSDKTIKLWNPSTGELLRTLSGHIGSVFTVAFSPDGSKIASAGQDNTLRVWDVATGQQLSSITTGFDATRAVLWSKDGNLLVSGGDDRKIHFYNSTTGRELYVQNAGLYPVFALAWSNDGSQLFSGSASGIVQAWKVVNN